MITAESLNLVGNANSNLLFSVGYLVSKMDGCVNYSTEIRPLLCVVRLLQ